MPVFDSQIQIEHYQWILEINPPQIGDLGQTLVKGIAMDEKRFDRLMGTRLMVKVGFEG